MGTVAGTGGDPGAAPTLLLLLLCARPLTFQAFPGRGSSCWTLRGCESQRQYKGHWPPSLRLGIPAAASASLSRLSRRGTGTGCLAKLLLWQLRLPGMGSTRPFPQPHFQPPSRSNHLSLQLLSPWTLTQAPSSSSLGQSFSPKYLFLQLPWRDGHSITVPGFLSSQRLSPTGGGTDMKATPEGTRTQLGIPSQRPWWGSGLPSNTDNFSAGR